MRGPDYTSVDIKSPLTIRDPQEASITALRMPAFQHALMSGWGGPPQVSTMSIYTLAGWVSNVTRSYRVPPGVTEVDVEVRASGKGLVKIESDEDTTGVSLWFADSFVGEEPAPHAANDMRGGRLVVLAAPVWEWTDVDLYIECTTDLGVNLETYTLTVYPHHVPR